MSGVDILWWSQDTNNLDWNIYWSDRFIIFVTSKMGQYWWFELHVSEVTLCGVMLWHCNFPMPICHVNVTNKECQGYVKLLGVHFDAKLNVKKQLWNPKCSFGTLKHLFKDVFMLFNLFILSQYIF